ncbi:MAG: aldehyde dehydrogenase family protein [Ideonella sp.]|nr:aldehyde dehydrogenase family protein [Ideonella sp.]
MARGFPPSSVRRSSSAGTTSPRPTGKRRGRLISREQRPLAEGRGEVSLCRELRGSGSPRRRHAPTAIAIPVGAGPEVYVRAEGAAGVVVAVITPWNFPAAMIARKIGCRRYCRLHGRRQAG